jgi:hypothetical protein
MDSVVEQRQVEDDDQPLSSLGGAALTVRSEFIEVPSCRKKTQHEHLIRESSARYFGMDHFFSGFPLVDWRAAIRIPVIFEPILLGIAGLFFERGRRKEHIVAVGSRVHNHL